MYTFLLLSTFIGLFMIKLFINAYQWKSEDIRPVQDSCIMLFYPHTSLLDAICLVTMRMKYKIKIFFLGKNKHYYNKWYSLFYRTLCPNIIATDAKDTNTDYIVNKLNKEKCYLMIAPEGQRKYTKYWKKGFYYISLNTSLPIIFNFPCWKKKIVYHSKPIFAKDHSIDEVIEMAREFYSQYDLTDAVNKDQVGEIQIKKN